MNIDVDFPDMGYYIYNNKFYTDKFLIFQDALLNKDYDPKIKFWFHDELYKTIDTTEEPIFDISFLYKLRAQKLREKYDKIILMYSGGSDSHQVLMTFLKNDIFIDEIHVVALESALEKIDIIPNPYHPYGLYFEHQLSVIPMLKHISIVSPNTKIKIFDYTHKICEFYSERFTTDKLDLNQPRHFFMNHNSGILRAGYMAEYLQEYIDSYGGKNGIIIGSDKPYIYLTHDTVFLAFGDDIRSGTKYQTIKNKTNNYNVEMFFWNGDVPLIPVKQAHMIKKYLSLHPEYANKRNNIDEWLNEMKTIIYPDWNNDIYQKKQKGNDEKIVSDLFPELKLDNIIRYKKDFFFDKFKKLKRFSNENALLSTKTETIFSNFYKIGKYRQII